MSEKPVLRGWWIIPAALIGALIWAAAISTVFF